MVDKEQFVTELELSGYTPEEQEALYQDFTYELGAAISDGMSEAQMEEFTAIIDGNDEVINTWLATNAPNYREEPAFKELQVGYDEDPEKVPAEKVFASMGWVRLNRPDLEQVLARVKREFKQSISAA